MLRDNKGIGTLLVVTVVAVVLAIVGAGIVRLSYSHYKLTKEKSVDKEKAYYFALGGIQKAVHEVQKDSAVGYYYGGSTTPEAVGSVVVPGENWEGIVLQNVQIIGNSSTNSNLPVGAYEIEATVNY